jgi:catechol 2,3-dioxygenase-like lactoylglutathione lyase family enzyme
MSKILAVHHIALLVNDLQRAREFYEGILGLVPDSARPVMGFDGIWYSLGAVQIHLLCLPHPEAATASLQHGGRERHLALLVTDWDGLRACLTQNQIEYTLSQTGRRALFCRDPDANVLELIADKAGPL